MNNLVQKIYLKTICIKNFYYYQIFQIRAGSVKWLMAEPKTKGVTRTANTEKELLAMLENDIVNVIRFEQKVR